MQNLFKRSLAMVLTLMMIITMFSGAISVSAAEAYTSNEPESVTDLWHMADLLATDTSYNQANNMQYLAQEFVPGTSTISGVDLAFKLTGDSAVMHLELRKDDPNSTAVWSKDIPFVSRGDVTYSWYEFNFDEDVAVTAGDVYYICFWLTSKGHPGNAALYEGAVATGGHPAYLQKMFDGETLTQPTNLAQNPHAVPFRIKSGTGINTLLAHADTDTGIVYPAGNQSGANDTNGSRYADEFTEGGASNMSHWGTVAVGDTGKMFFGTTAIGGKDLTKAKYIVFDMYVHGFDWNPNSVSNPKLIFGAAGGGWSAEDLLNFSTKPFMPETLVEGWNQIVIPLETAQWKAAPTNVGVLSLRWDGGENGTNAVKFTATDAYVLFDNVRAYDQAGYDAAHPLSDVEKVIEAIDGLDKTTIAMLNDGTVEKNQAGDTLIIHKSTSRYTMSVNQNGAKFSKIGFTGANNVDIGFRGAAVNPSEYDYLAFDLYLSEGAVVNAADNTDPFAHAIYQKAWSDNISKTDAETVAYDDNLKTVVRDTAKPGEWVTIKLDCSNVNADISQIGLRIKNFTMAKDVDYLIIKDVRFEAVSEMTLEDKDAVYAVKAMYDALSDEDKALVTNADVLQGYLDYLATLEPDVDKVQKVIDAINGLTEATSTLFNAGTAATNEGGDTVVFCKATNRYTMSVDENGTKLLKNSFDGAHSPDIAFRSDAVNPSDYDYLAFDLYLSEGVSVNDPSNTNIYAHVLYQGAWTDNISKSATETVAYDDNLKVVIGDNAKAGQWVTIKIDCSNVDADINQVGLRINNFTMKKDVDYLIIKNVRFEGVTKLTLEDKDAVYAVKDMFDALTDDEKALVTNADVLQGHLDYLATLEPVNIVDVPFRALDKSNDLNKSGVQIAIDNSKRLEGTGSLAVTTTDATATSNLMLYVYSLGQASNPINIAGATHMIFDLWVPADNIFDNIAGDAQVCIDDTDHMNAWATSGGHVSANTIRDAMKGLKAGWNHIVLALDETATCTNVGDLRFHMGNTGIAADQVLYFDDIRFVNEAALNSTVADRNEAKAVIIDISELPETNALTIDDKAAVEAVETAYAALTAEQQALVINKDVLDAASAKIDALESAAKALDVQFRALDKSNELNQSGVVLAINNSKRLEGTGSLAVTATAGTADGNFMLYIYSLGQASNPINIAGATHMTMDIYVPADNYFNTIAGDAGVNMDDADNVSKWGSSAGKISAATVKAAMKNLKAGWNHVVMPLDAEATSTKLVDIRFYMIKTGAKEGDVVYVDDIRFVNEAALNSTVANRNEAKAVSIAIDALPADATADSAEVVAIKEAYAALTAEQQALVVNYDVIENLGAAPAEPYELQLHAMDKIDMQISAGGNNATHGVQGIVTSDNYVEGTGAHYSDWGTNIKEGDEGSLYMSLTNLPDVDFSKVDYISFDLYVHGFKWDFGAHPGHDCDVRLGSAASWNSNDLFSYGNAALNSYLKDIKEGWNHILIPIDTNATGVKNLWFYGEKAITFTATDAYVLFDDFRIFNEAAKEAVVARNAAKDLVATINGLTVDDAEGIAAAKAAYAELSEDLQAYVVNYGRLTELDSAAADAQAVIDAINGLIGATTVFNDGTVETNEGGDVLVFNKTTSRYTMTVDENGAKLTKAGFDGSHNLDIAFRSDAVNPSDYDYLAFDLYLSEGVSVNDPTNNNIWAHVLYQGAWTDNISKNAPDTVTADDNLKIAIGDNAKAGEWVTIKLDCSAVDADINQVALRINNFTMKKDVDYLIIKNVRFVSGSGKAQPTYADKAGIDAIKAQYDALSDQAKALVTNADTLAGYVEYLAAQEAAAAAVVNAINALPPVASEDPEAAVLALSDKPAVEKARADYDALEADTKVLVTNLATLAAAEVRIDELEESAGAEAVAKVISDQIAALPEAAAVVVDDEAAIVAARKAYDEAKDDVKALVEGLDKLAACEAALAQAKADKQAAADIIAAIEDLPVPALAADKEAVDAAKALYDAASEAVQSYVSNYSVLEAAIASVAQDEKDIADADAVKALIEALPAKKDITADDAAQVKEAKAAYDALTDAAKAYVGEDAAATLNDAVVAIGMFEAVDVQWRALDARGSDTNIGGTAGPDKNTLDKNNQLEGSAAMSYSWTSEKTGDLHLFYYYYDQKFTQPTTVDGSLSFLATGLKDMYIVFDLYVSDPQVLKDKDDAGLSVDFFEANKWGSGKKAASAKKSDFVALVNALQPGWNQMIVPLEFKYNALGTFCDAYDMKFYWGKVTVPNGFEMKVDDIRFMNAMALEEIQPLRKAAKDLTLAIRALTDDSTFADYSAIADAYTVLAPEYQSVVIGYDAFYTAYTEKFASEIAAKEALDRAAADAVIQKIDSVKESYLLFNEMEQIKDEEETHFVVGNLNSGAYDLEFVTDIKTQGESASKFIKKSAGQQDLSVAISYDGFINPSDYLYVEFDLYLSDGIEPLTGNLGEWANIMLHNKYTTSILAEDSVAKIDIKSYVSGIAPGWNHIKVPVNYDGDICQITIRLSNRKGDAGEYFIIDNVVFASEGLTLDRKADVESARNAYEALTPVQKNLVTNLMDLENAEATIIVLEDEKAASTVNDMILALPTEVTDLAADKAKVEAARAAYEDLTENQKAMITALAVLEGAEAMIKAAEEAAAKLEADKAAAKPVEDKIAALPTEITDFDADKAKVDEAAAAYEALTDDQKALVTNKAALDAAKAMIDAYVPPVDVTYGDINKDTKVDATDALWALQVSVNKRTLDESATKAADVNGDTKVDAADALLILKKSVDKIEKFPVEETEAAQ